MKLQRLMGTAAIAALAAAFIIASAGVGEAAKKKAAAAAPTPQGSCLLSSEKSVCATKGGMSFTYRNACYAANDGAKKVKDSACKAAKMAKMAKGKKKKM